ncbi:MAG: 5-formyltetrahydrofolate cyclo-ligase [Cyanobacteria bacterium]|nr:5-formyltetrahydrofolate cyclo-ligase [Cyanobacteriota bacterium]
MITLSDLSLEKATLRKDYRALRQKLALTAHGSIATTYLQVLHHADWFQQAMFLGGYAARSDELPFWWVMEQTLDKSWYLPKINPDIDQERSQELTFLKYTGAKSELSLGRFGILEPAETAIKPEEALQVLFIPALAYDLRGYRLGYGKGYYDRYLSSPEEAQKRPLLVGVAHSMLLTDRLPREPYDVPVDILLTEQGLITTR